MSQAAAVPRTASIEIVLADDHDMVRTGIKGLLQQIPGTTVVGEARDGRELLALLSRRRCDVVFTDLSMPGLDGFEALAEIKKLYPGIHVLILSMHASSESVKRAVASGAAGYLPKGAPAEELERAVRSVMLTGAYFSPQVTRQLLTPDAPAASDKLTERQTEILTMMARGLSSKEIGFELGLSSKTVDAHRARIMERLGINDVAGLTLYAVRKGLVQP